MGIRSTTTCYALGVIALLRRRDGAQAYAGIGPVLYLPHAETTVDGRPGAWGYALGGAGIEAVAGIGDPVRGFGEITADAGRHTVGVSGGGASTAVQPVHAAIAT